jgi:aryl-alcohol dehydrogenase-like predicted oxidoreductase
MKYKKLGNSDLNVSRICMGCMGFGDPGRGQHSWTIDEEHTREIIKRGLELGVNFYDTAIAYQSGTSEQYVGRALRDFAKRDEVVVATKFLPRTQDEIENGISGQQHIENMINTSLQNLGMDYVDLYIYHMWDWQTPIYDIMDGLTRIVKAGKARYIGISNCFAWQIAKANALAEKEGFAKFVSVQGHYNLIFREEEREMVPYCNEENIALTPYSALASGRLSRLPGEGGTKRAEEDAYAKFKYDATAAQDNVIIARVAEVAEKHDLTIYYVDCGKNLESEDLEKLEVVAKNVLGARGVMVPIVFSIVNGEALGKHIGTVAEEDGLLTEEQWDKTRQIYERLLEDWIK